MHKTAVINVVGLTSALLGAHTPFLSRWTSRNGCSRIQPVLPAVTCSAQATYLTGSYPDQHGIVANGWYFSDECEVKFWRQSNKLVQAPKVWETARERDPKFTCANLFWWYNMYSSVDIAVTPRPQYLADGRKLPDIYTTPPSWRDDLQKELGTFPLFQFWGPATTIASSRWIADATILTDQRFDPTLTLVYLPHLDYNLQRYGTQHPTVYKDLEEIDAECEKLITYFESKGARIIILSEYGITDVSKPVHLNRILRERGLLTVRTENGGETLDAGASAAFAAADHQVAHVYVNDKQRREEVRALLEHTAGIELVLDEDGKRKYHLDHDRSGDFVVVADKDAWFTYYPWLDDAKAPDFARIVDIHRKPGYDPVEMLLNPEFVVPKLVVASKLLRKMLGFRYVMDVIPLDATLIKGSHGRIHIGPEHFPVLAGNYGPYEDLISPTSVRDLILSHLFD